MTGSLADEARAAALQFAIDGELIELVPHERGHIHDTFISTWQQNGSTHRFLHQRLNDNVFRDVPGLMHNIERVTQHLHHAVGEAVPENELEALRLVRTRADAAYLDENGSAWRTYDFVDGAESFDRCNGEDQAYAAAQAFGGFQARLLDLDAGELRETLPNFFSSPFRFRQLDDALAADVSGRVASAAAELEFVDARRRMAPVIDDYMSAGRFPARVVHGDTKLNNVLFDIESGRARCVVDLDTCMPGYSLYDFGDLVRFTAATSAEDERDPHLAGVDKDLYAALAAGYLEKAQGFLTELERELMPFAARLVTLTIGVRFLTDYLAGDVYFKTARESHNLDRARVQLRMVQQMELREGVLRPH